MASIGDRLREARTRRGLSFDDVESATKVRARYLRALEAEQFDILPGPTFARTFLRTYADYLGLDSRLLVEEYRLQYGPPDEATDPQFAPVASGGRTPVGPPVSLPGPAALLGGAVAVVLLFFLVLGLLVGEEQPAPEGAQQGEQAAAERDRRERAPRRRRPRPVPTSVALRIAPTVPTYVCVEDGAGQTRYEGVLAGPRTWRGRRLRVNLGKRSPRVTVNGRRVPFDTSLATPIAFDFRPRGRRVVPPGQGPCT